MPGGGPFPTRVTGRPPGWPGRCLRLGARYSRRMPAVTLVARHSSAARPVRRRSDRRARVAAAVVADETLVFAGEGFLVPIDGLAGRYGTGHGPVTGIVHWPIACMAAGVHARRRLERKVIQAGRDERTCLRFSRISIARCADVIRSSASAWGPLSQSVHRVTGARATDQRPCAQDLRPGGVGGTAGLLRRELAGANWQAWLCRLVTPGSVLSGVPGMAGISSGI
jgi:hypothetical protein